MLQTQAAIAVREHRREAARAARLAHFTASAAEHAPRPPATPSKPYKPDLSAVPPGVLRALQAAINAIDRHDAVGAPQLRRRRDPSASGLTRV